MHLQQLKEMLDEIGLDGIVALTLKASMESNGLKFHQVKEILIDTVATTRERDLEDYL